MLFRSVSQSRYGGERGWSMPFEAIKDETAGNKQKMIISNIVGSGAGGEIDVAIVELDDAGAILQGCKTT